MNVPETLCVRRDSAQLIAELLQVCIAHHLRRPAGARAEDYFLSTLVAAHMLVEIMRAPLDATNAHDVAREWRQAAKRWNDDVANYGGSHGVPHPLLTFAEQGAPPPSAWCWKAPNPGVGGGA